MSVDFAEVVLVVGGVVIAILAITRSRAGGIQLSLGMIGLGACWFLRPPGFADAVRMTSSGQEIFIREPVLLAAIGVSVVLALFGLARTLQGDGRPAPVAKPAVASELPRPVDADIASWDRIADKDNADALQEYMLRHPEGRFVELARIKLERMGVAPLKSPAREPAEQQPAVREPATKTPPPWATTTTEDDLLFPSEKAAKRIEPRDDLFASAASRPTRHPEPKGNAAPMAAGVMILLAAAGGGGYWALNGGLDALGAQGGALEDAVADAGSPPALSIAAAPGEQAMTAEVDAVSAPAPAEIPPLYDVQPPTNTKLVLVKGNNVRLRAAPFANDATGVVAIAKPGAALRVTGRVARPDWTWYEIAMDDGRRAYIRSDVTSVPERGPEAPKEAAPPMAITRAEALPPPPLQTPQTQLPVADDRPNAQPESQVTDSAPAAAPVASDPADAISPQPAPLPAISG